MSERKPHECPACGGTGSKDGETCRACAGTCIVWEPVEESREVPSGDDPLDLTYRR